MVDAVVVDDLGVGGGVVDRLRELGLGRARVAPFIGSAQAQDSERFYNRAAEVWWKMAEAYRARGAGYGGRPGADRAGVEPEAGAGA